MNKSRAFAIFAQPTWTCCVLIALCPVLILTPHHYQHGSKVRAPLLLWKQVCPFVSLFIPTLIVYITQALLHHLSSPSTEFYALESIILRIWRSTTRAC